MATTRRPWSRTVLSGASNSAVLVGIAGRSLFLWIRSCGYDPVAMILCLSGTGLRRFIPAEIAVIGTEFSAGIRVQQSRKARILGQVMKIRVVARLETKLRI